MRDTVRRSAQVADTVTCKRPGRRVSPRPTWAVLLAGGDGARLLGASVNGAPIDRPKQFCRFGRDDSLLGSTLHRARRLSGPATILPVVLEKHRVWWQAELRHLPAQDVLVQPCNRGTAVAVMHALFHILQRGDDAVVVVYPCDHGVEEERPLLGALDDAVRAAASFPDDLVLVGVTPRDPEAQYGWIVPAASGVERVPRVRAFVEKPAPAEASRLMEQGGLWNSFLFAVSARGLLALFARTVPGLMERYLWRMPEDGWRGTSLSDCYASLPYADFSRDVLEHSVAHLRVVPVRDSGWTDLGTPSRLEAWLRQQRSRVSEETTQEVESWTSREIR